MKLKMEVNFDFGKLANKLPKIIHNQLDRMICGFLQMFPKYTGRFVQTYGSNGIWNVMPEKNNLAKKLNVTSNKKCVRNNGCIPQINHIGENCDDINQDGVDPVASLLIQKKTLEYFANTKVQDRIFSQVY